MRIWREATPSEGVARPGAPIFPNNNHLFVYLLLRKIITTFAKIIYLRSPSRLGLARPVSGLAARCAGGRRARRPRRTPRARLAVTRLYGIPH